MAAFVLELVLLLLPFLSKTNTVLNQNIRRNNSERYCNILSMSMRFILSKEPRSASSINVNLSSGTWFSVGSSQQERSDTNQGVSICFTSVVSCIVKMRPGAKRTGVSSALEFWLLITLKDVADGHQRIFVVFWQTNGFALRIAHERLEVIHHFIFGHLMIG